VVNESNRGFSGSASGRHRFPSAKVLSGAPEAFGCVFHEGAQAPMASFVNRKRGQGPPDCSTANGSPEGPDRQPKDPSALPAEGPGQDSVPQSPRCEFVVAASSAAQQFCLKRQHVR